MSKRKWKHSSIPIIEAFISDRFDDDDWITVRVREVKSYLYDVGEKMKIHYKKYYKKLYEKDN